MATGKKTKRVVEAEGIAHVSATFNNTTITITDTHGNAVSWGSSGKAGFKGSKKSHAVRRHRRRRAVRARSAHGRCAPRARARAGPGQRPRVGHPGARRRRASQVKSIKDVTPIPHNGCRPPKRRRV